MSRLGQIIENTEDDIVVVFYRVRGLERCITLAAREHAVISPDALVCEVKALDRIRSGKILIRPVSEEGTI